MENCNVQCWHFCSSQTMSTYGETKACMVSRSSFWGKTSFPSINTLLFQHFADAKVVIDVHSRTFRLTSAARDGRLSLFRVLALQFNDWRSFMSASEVALEQRAFRIASLCYSCMFSHTLSLHIFERGVERLADMSACLILDVTALHWSSCLQSGTVVLFLIVSSKGTQVQNFSK